MLFVGILTLSVTNHSLAQDNIDNYTYSLGSGDLVINDTDDDNSLTFSNDISPESLQLSADLQNLYITLPDNAVITVVNWLVLQRQGNPFRINRFIFLDGSDVWNYPNIASKTIINGTTGDDVIELAMTNINWHIKPGAGNDEITLWKKYGQHTYYYNLGDGSDLIHNKSSEGSRLILGPGIAPEDIILQATMDLMQISFSDGAVITIDNWATGYTYGPFAISTIEFSDGTIWNYQHVGSVMVLQGTNAGDVFELSHLSLPIGIRGGEGDDQIVMGKGKHTYFYDLGDGTDTINDADIYGTMIWGEGINPLNLSISATAERLTYNLPDGSLIYVDSWFKGSTSYPFSINNMIFFDGTVWDYRAVGKNTIFAGTDQNDIIDFSEYNLTIGVRAGKGDDTLVFASGERDYYYDPGDGNDTIDSSSLYDRLHLGQGILPDQIRFRATGLDMQILLPDNAVITVLNWDTGYRSWDFRLNKIYFSNGVVWDLKEIARQIERSNDNPDPVPGLLHVSGQPYQVVSFDPEHDLTGQAEISDDGKALNLTGNLWKKIDVNYPITPNTILEFDFSSTAEGELHGIGFDNDLSQDVNNNGFKLFGTQSEGIQNFDTYQTPGQVSHYTIPVGQFLSGSYQYLYFFNDHDVSSPSAQSTFSNIKLYEQEPGNLAPTVAIISPVEGTQITQGKALDILIDAVDSDGQITNVVLTVNGQIIGQWGQAPFSVQWLPPEIGVYTLAAQATDNEDVMASAQSVQVTVVEEDKPNTPPQAQDVYLNVNRDALVLLYDLALSVTDDNGIDWQTLSLSGPSRGQVRHLSPTSGQIELDYSGVSFVGEERLTYRVMDTDGLQSNPAKLIININVTAAPEPPTQLVITLDETNRRADIGWQHSDPQVQFTLSYKKVGDGEWQPLSVGLQAKSAALPNPDNGSYLFRVIACSVQDGQICSLPVESQAVAVNWRPLPINAVEAQISPQGQVRLNWSAVNSATFYQVYKKLGAETATLVDGQVTLFPYLFSMTAGDLNGSYRFAVAACNESGCSDKVYSSEQSVQLLPDAPESVTYAENSEPAYLLAWSAVENADYYQVQRMDSQGAWHDFLPSESQTQVTAAPVSGSQQVFQVSACNIFGCSDFTLATQTDVNDSPDNLISAFYADTQVLAGPGEEVTLAWQAQGAVDVRLSTEWQGQSSTLQDNLPVLGTLKIQPQHSQDILLVAKNINGQAQQERVRIIVKAVHTSRWQVTDDATQSVLPSSMLVADDGRRYFGDLSGRLHKSGAGPDWVLEDIGQVVSPPLEKDNRLFVTANNSQGKGMLYRLDKADGQNLLQQVLPISVVASPVFWSNGVLVTTTAGQIYHFDLALSQVPIPIISLNLSPGEQIRSTPVVVGNMAYIRTNQGILHRVNLSQAVAAGMALSDNLGEQEWTVDLREGM
ncbi:calcium-binding protein [Bowmanella denitrificans]|uniref:calcium-binding protein n=1 Tax=Bowmanella denitrificans TaxID=366582 RepID=UPI0031D9B90D